MGNVRTLLEHIRSTEAESLMQPEGVHVHSSGHSELQSDTLS